MIEGKEIKKHTEHKSSTCFDENEICLVDIFKVFARRKKIFVITTLIVFAISISSLWFVTPVYEGKAIVKIGHIGKQGKIEDAGVLAQRLKYEYSFISKINTNNNFIVIGVRGQERKKIEQQLKKVTEKLLERHNVIYNRKVLNENKSRNLLQEKIKNIRSEIAELLPFINKIRTTEPVQAAFLILDKGKLMDRLMTLEEKKAALMMDFDPKYLQSTIVIREPHVTDRPINQKVKLVIVISILLSIIIGIVSAFVADFMIKIRQEMMAAEK